MKPGDSTRPEALIRVFAGTLRKSPMAAMRSPEIAISPINQGAPVPSTIRAPLTMKSYLSWAAAGSSTKKKATKAIRQKWIFSFLFIWLGPLTDSLPHHFLDHAEKVPAHDLPNVVFRVAALQQLSGKIGDLGNVFEPARHEADSVEVAAYADMIDTRNFHHVINTRRRILHRGVSHFSVFTVEVFFCGDLVERRTGHVGLHLILARDGLLELIGIFLVQK